MNLKNFFCDFSGGGGGGGGAPQQTQAQLDAEVRAKILDNQLIEANKANEVDRVNSNARLTMATTEKARLQQLINQKRDLRSRGNNAGMGGNIGTGIQISTGT